MTTVTDNPSLLKAVEVWHVTNDGQHLVLAGGGYAGVDCFETASRGRRFRIGEGLPGWTAQARLPVIFDDLSSADFLRREAAGQDALSAGIGLPVYDGDNVTAVILFLCGSGPGRTGAFESWLPDGSRQELALGTGYYSNLEQFRRLTQYLRFPYGAGLPGECWQTRTPRLMDRLADSTDFLRAAGAQVDGLDFGLAVPIVSGEDTVQAVFVMLSSAVSPLARTLQVYTVSESGAELSTTVASEVTAQEWGNDRHWSAPSTGLIEGVLRSRRPIVRQLQHDSTIPAAAATESPRSKPTPTDDPRPASALHWVLAWPVIVQRRVRAVCLMMN